MENNSKKQLTALFNAAILIYMLFAYMVEYLFTPETQDVPWDLVYNYNPFLGFAGAFLLVIILILGAAQIIRYFWNRFIVDVFHLREIIFQEAISILLIFSLFAIG